MTIKTAAELRQRSNGQTIAQQYADVRAALQARYDAGKDILDTVDVEGRKDLRASERRAYDEHEDEIRRLVTLQQQIEASPEAQKIDRSRLAGYGIEGAASEYRQGVPLSRTQTAEGYVRSRGLIREDEEQLDFGRYLRGMATGTWDNAEGERRAMAEGATGSGGYLVPTLLSSQIIDMVRNQTRVIDAGATIVPMENRTLDVPKWTGDPTAAWRTENSLITPSDATLGKLTLTAQSLAANVEVSWELLEDAPAVQTKLMEAFAAAFALKLDLAALYGSGTAPEPRGVKNATGISTASLGTNGASLTSYDFLVDSVGRLQDQNEQPTGIIYAGRTARSLAKLKDSTGQSLTVPGYIADLPRYSTGQIPTTLTTGTNSDTSDVFTADWRQLLIGVRTQLQIIPLTERYADYAQRGFIAWWRGDIAVARPKAFDVVTGVRP